MRRYNFNYLADLEEARLPWLSHVPGPWFDEHPMPVAAASQFNYCHPTAWPPQLRMPLFCERPCNSSTIAHRVIDATTA